jgi:cytochrome c-type biogenesis protein CcmE
LTVAALFVLNAFRSNLVFFYSPTEVLDGKAPEDRMFRIGGMVENGSVRREPNSLKISFVVTDLRNRLPVYFEGILPDLFREGQGIVVQGKLREDRIFLAHEVLAKHDENYMPPEAAKAIQGGSFVPGGETKRP